MTACHFDIPTINTAPANARKHFCTSGTTGTEYQQEPSLLLHPQSDKFPRKGKKKRTKKKKEREEKKKGKEWRKRDDADNVTTRQSKLFFRGKRNTKSIVLREVSSYDFPLGIPCVGSKTNMLGLRGIIIVSG